MSDILSLFRVLYPHLSMTMTQVRQFSCVVSGMLAMTGRVSMRNLSRWTPKGGSYRTIQRSHRSPVVCDLLVIFSDVPLRS